MTDDKITARDGSRVCKALLVLASGHDDVAHHISALQARLRPTGWGVESVPLPSAAVRHAHPSRADLAKFVLDAYFASISRHHPSRVAVLGAGIGGYLAALLAAARPVDMLALVSPWVFPDEGWTRPINELRSEEITHHRAHTTVLRVCAQFDGDVLIIENGRDNSGCAAKLYQDCFTKAKSIRRQKFSVKRIGSSAPDYESGIADALVDWLCGPNDKA